MTEQVAQGEQIVLYVEWWEYEGGPASAVTGTTVTITLVGAGSATIGPTAATHQTTGLDTYTWTLSATQTVGAYSVVWNGTGPGGAVQASEIISVVAAGSTGTTQTGVAWYCIREDVKSALDIKLTARSDSQVDNAIIAATDTIEGALHRRFYPMTVTRYWPWPSRTPGMRPWRLWLDADELISINTLTAGGVEIVEGDYLLEPINSGPPYTNVQIDLSSNAVFAAGSTWQRAISIDGVFGHSAREAAAGALAENLDATETGVDVTNSIAVGVGSIIRVDSERMLVTGKTMVTTGQTLGGNLTALASNTTVAVTTGSAYTVGETLLIDAERMLIVDIAGNNLTVKRQWDGSVLAAHTAGATIYAPRTLTVERGAYGTTAATHATTTSIYAHVVPGIIREWAVAEAVNTLIQRGSGYARTTGSGENERETSGRGLKQIRADAWIAFGRKARVRSV